MMLALPTLCIRFDIEKIEKKFNGGSYGSSCYQQVYKAVSIQMLMGCSMFMGDSSATLNGQENVCVIGLQSRSEEQLKAVQQSLLGNKDFAEVCANNPLVYSASGSLEPLVFDGIMSQTGVQVEAGKSSWAQIAYNVVLKERQTTAPIKPQFEVVPPVLTPADKTQGNIFCSECGKNIPSGSVFCPECGYKQYTGQATTATQSVKPSSSVPVGTPIPSLYALKCPSCGSGAYQVLGEKGSAAQSAGVFLAFGAIGNMVTSSHAAKNMETSPLQYKCGSCGNKFISAPLQAQPEEMLTAPCMVNFQRISSFVGAAIAHIVYLNGIKIGPVKNGQAIAFPTYIRYNTIFVTDPHGVAFKDMYRFEAQPGGTVWARFNRKFQ